MKAIIFYMFYNKLFCLGTVPAWKKIRIIAFCPILHNKKIAFKIQKRPEVNNYDNDIARYIDRKAYSTAFRSFYKKQPVGV